MKCISKTSKTFDWKRHDVEKSAICIALQTELWRIYANRCLAHDLLICSHLRNNMILRHRLILKWTEENFWKAKTKCYLEAPSCFEAALWRSFFDASKDDLIWGEKDIEFTPAFLTNPLIPTKIDEDAGVQEAKWRCLKPTVTLR